MLRPGLPERAFEDGELLVRQGEQGTFMMYILEGQVEVTVRLQIPRDGSSLRYSLTCLLAHSLVFSLAHSLTTQLVSELARWLIPHSLTHSLTQSLPHSLTHPCHLLVTHSVSCSSSPPVLSTQCIPHEVGTSCWQTQLGQHKQLFSGGVHSVSMCAYFVE